MEFKQYHEYRWHNTCRLANGNKKQTCKKGINFPFRSRSAICHKEIYQCIRILWCNPKYVRKGNCWDNAVAESFFKSLKTELIYGNKLVTKEQMKIDVFEYIEIWYNKKRRHRALNYKTIEEFNNQNQFYKNVA